MRGRMKTRGRRVTQQSLSKVKGKKTPGLGDVLSKPADLGFCKTCKEKKTTALTLVHRKYLKRSGGLVVAGGEDKDLARRAVLELVEILAKEKLRKLAAGETGGRPRGRCRHSPEVLVKQKID